MDPNQCLPSMNNCCCSWWTDGCGCNACFGACADGLEVINPIMEYCADCIWVLGSPLAFPIIFCFPPGPETNPPGGGWRLPMLQTPIRTPLQCCFYTICMPCGQWHMRRQLLNYDMTKYKLWQGYYDGPQCMARRCPGAPITIQAGIYGEQNCPNLFLCAEVWILGGFFSTCCAFNVNRRMIKEQRHLGDDPTEQRVHKCVGFFSQLAQQCCMLGCCMSICGCCVEFCAPDSAAAQACGGDAVRAGSACMQCAMTCWRGIWSVQVISNGCMSAQMEYELKEGQPLPQAPKKARMERGEPGTLDDDENEDAWWKKPPPK